MGTVVKKAVYDKAVTKKLADIANSFVAEFPEYKIDLDNHIEINEEILSYVFFPPIFDDYIKDKLRANTEASWLKRLFAFFEQMAACGDQDIKDLLSLTFLDHLRDDAEVLEVGKTYCGPQTRILLDNVLRFYGYLPPLEHDKSEDLPEKKRRAKKPKKKSRDVVLAKRHNNIGGSSK
jgi:hypothetical protein